MGTNLNARGESSAILLIQLSRATEARSNQTNGRREHGLLDFLDFGLCASAPLWLRDTKVTRIARVSEADFGSSIRAITTVRAGGAGPRADLNGAIHLPPGGRGCAPRVSDSPAQSAAARDRPADRPR